MTRDLHDAVPVVASSNAKERQKCDAEVLEVGVSVETLTRMLLRTLCNTKLILSHFFCLLVISLITLITLLVSQSSKRDGYGVILDRRS